MKKTLTYLITAIAFMLVSVGAIAQGGTNPFVGSSHDYTVTPEDVNNTLLWADTQTGGYTINSQDVSGLTSVANIKWTAAGTYTLTFTETDVNSCSTVKQMTVTVALNTFDVSTSNPAAVCNNAIDTTNPALNITTIVFDVVDTTGVATWNPNWEITFTLTPGTGATIGTVYASIGDLSGTGPYTLTDITNPNSDGTGATAISVEVAGDAFAELTVNLEITAAMELDYETPDIDQDDWTATGIIHAIPNTSNITTD